MIGAVIDKTGTNAAPSWGDAIKLAVEHMNAALDKTKFKNDSFRFKVDVHDSEQDPEIANTRLLELKQAGAKALIGDSSQNAKAASATYYDDDAANDLGVPYQCGSCTSSSINNPSVTGDTAANKASRDEEHSDLSQQHVDRAGVQGGGASHHGNGHRSRWRCQRRWHFQDLVLPHE